MRKGLRCLVLLLGAALLVAGCGGRKHDRGTLEGYAFARGPLAGATIQAVDTNGKVIATAPEKTLSSGLWFLPMDDPPKEFTLVTSGGTDGGVKFGDRMRRRVRDYAHREPHTLDITLPTTLVDDYLTVHKDADYRQSERKVASFLGVPKGLNLESDVRDTDAFFSGDAFMRDARKAGGVAPFVAQLQHELDSGRTSHLFPRPKHARSLQIEIPILGVISNFQALQGVGAAASLVTGIISAVHGSEQAALLQQISSQLQSIAASITNLASSISTLEEDLQHQDYSTAVTQTPGIGTIDTDLSSGASTKDGNPITLWELYQAIVDAAADPNSSATDLTAAETNFENAMTRLGSDLDVFFGVGEGPDAIYGGLVSGNSGKTGALIDWQHTTSNRFVTAATQANTASALNYWLGEQTEVIALDSAYVDLLENPPGSPTTTATDTTATTGTTTTAQATDPCQVSDPSQVQQYACDVETYEAEYGPAAESAARANCTPLSSSDPNYASRSNDNKLEDELDDSGTCVSQLPTYGPDLIVDQTTGLMWAATEWDTTYVQANVVTTGALAAFAPLSWTGWNYPHISDLQTLNSTSGGQWNAQGLPVTVSGTDFTVENPIDVLSGYAQSAFFQRLWLLDRGPSPGQQPNNEAPGDFSPYIWSVDQGTCSQCSAGEGSHQVYNLEDGKVWNFCNDAANDNVCISALDRGGGIINNSHANDFANFMEVRPLANGESYADGVGLSG